MPSVWLARQMGLSWGQRRFTFVDPSGAVVAYDPAHEAGGGGSGLVVAHAPVQNFLRRSGLALLWLMIGEKLILNGSNRLDDEDRPVIEVFRQAYTFDGTRVERVVRSACPLGDPPDEY
jgi:hypothetical protein